MNLLVCSLMTILRIKSLLLRKGRQSMIQKNHEIIVSEGYLIIFKKIKTRFVAEENGNNTYVKPIDINNTLISFDDM